MKEESKSQFIEREIVTGLITNDEYIKSIARIFNNECLESDTAKTLAKWCLDYFKKYGRAPKKDIQGIYDEKVRGDLDQAHAEWIESILQSLSGEYDQRGEEINVDYLLERTVKHFQDCQAKAYAWKIQEAVDKDDMDEFYNIHSTFKPIDLSDLFEEESLNAWDLYNKEIKEMDWLIRDLIPKGLTIMGGKSKAGKSYFVLNLAMMLAQGKKMFGEDDKTGFRGQRGPVLYLAVEDPERRFINRMKAIDPEPKPELLEKNLSPKFKWDKLSRSGLPAIEEWLKKRKNPKLVIIDVLARVWDKKSGTGGGGLYAEEYGIYAPLADLAHSYDTSIIVITHTIKGKAQDAFDEILGGSGTQGPADNLIVLSREGGNQRRFSIRGKDIGEEHYLFNTENEGAKWIYQGEVGEVQKTFERQAIYDLLESSGPMARNEIVTAAKDGEIPVSVNSVPVLLRKMVFDKVLEQSKKYGKYAVPGTMDSLINAGIANKLRKG
jgi:hypothetical protein